MSFSGTKGYITKPKPGVMVNPLHPLSRGLIGCWLFHEGSGNLVNDISGHGNNGNFGAAPPTWISTGLNFDMTVQDDYTDLIINNERLFADAIEMSRAIEIINTYRFSLRSNRNQRKSEEHLIRVIQEIEGQDEVGSVKIVGLRNRLSGKLTKLKKEIDKLRKGYFGGVIMVDTRS